MENSSSTLQPSLKSKAEEDKTQPHMVTSSKAFDQKPSDRKPQVT